MRLALAMGRTLRELYAALDAREMAEWEAFDLLEPLGFPAAERRFAATAALLQNAWYQGEPVSPAAMAYRHPLEDAAEARPAQSPDQMQAALRAAFGMGSRKGAGKGKSGKALNRRRRPGG
jgi:hypothetical protein